MPSYQGPAEAIEQFNEWCDTGKLVDASGFIHRPPLLADWPIYIDSEKAAIPAQIPADTHYHFIQLYGPTGYGHVWANARLKPVVHITREEEERGWVSYRPKPTAVP